MGIARLKKCTNTLSQSVGGVMDVKQWQLKMIWGRRREVWGTWMVLVSNDMIKVNAIILIPSHQDVINTTSCCHHHHYFNIHSLPRLIKGMDSCFPTA